MDWNRRGFTFVELMMVVAIIGVLAGVSAFNAFAVLPRYQLHAAARDFTSNLRLARRNAIKAAGNVQVVFDQFNNSYNVDGRQVPFRGSLEKYYGGGVSFGFGCATRSAATTSAQLPLSPITFRGNPRRVAFNQCGLSNAGSVYFTNRHGDCCAVVVSTSGRIRMRSWTGKKWK